MSETSRGLVGATKQVFGVIRTRLVEVRLVDRYLLSLNPKLRARNARFVSRGAPDGLPIPPPSLVYDVFERYDIEGFFTRGSLWAECIREILIRNGFNIGEFDSILDFGCGCGRVLRQWRSLVGPTLYGSDCNPRLVKWCQESLPFAKVSRNDSDSNLGYEDAAFDFVYAISVFTHLSESAQRFWFEEIARVLRPGGCLLVSVYGPSWIDRLAPAERRRFESGQLVVHNGRYSGKNVCEAFHPELYIRNQLARRYSVIDFVLTGANYAYQDVFLLQRKS